MRRETKFLEICKVTQCLPDLNLISTQDRNTHKLCQVQFIRSSNGKERIEAGSHLHFNRKHPTFGCHVPVPDHEWISIRLKVSRGLDKVKQSKHTMTLAMTPSKLRSSETVLSEGEPKHIVTSLYAFQQPNTGII